MKPIELYTTPFCGFCVAAKKLLAQKGVTYSEIDVFANPDRRREMVQRAGGRNTVPQIFVGETHVGGFTDMRALDQAGKLDPLITS